MTTPNYDASQPATPYVRATRLTIYYPAQEKPSVGIAQSLVIRAADGTLYEVGSMPELTEVFDLGADGDAPIPLVSPETGEPLGASTSLNQVFLHILAVVRAVQLKKG